MLLLNDVYCERKLGLINIKSEVSTNPFDHGIWASNICQENIYIHRYIAEITKKSRGINERCIFFLRYCDIKSQKGRKMNCNFNGVLYAVLKH